MGPFFYSLILICIKKVTKIERTLTKYLPLYDGLDERQQIIAAASSSLRLLSWSISHMYKVTN